MINKLKIENFKSIKNLQLNCKKINVFIGEPNSGKSNIVEALSLFSPTPLNLRQGIRMQNLTDIFYDNLTDRPIKILINSSLLTVELIDNQFKFSLKHIVIASSLQMPQDSENIIGIAGDARLNLDFSKENIKFYSYKPEILNPNRTPGALIPPYGENLVSVIISNSSFKGLVQEIFRSKGFRLKTKPVEFQIEISKEKDDEIYSYSYSNISETLKRIIFFMACLETNSNTTILFDEPEANTFPFYTKYFAERIASDQTNQFFFTTHNHYLLESIVAKAPFEDLNVIIAYMQDYETKLRVLTQGEVIELMSLDIFFNLKRYTGEL